MIVRAEHSIAAQGGINAAKNYQNDGDSVHRLFYDTIKGGDYRSREGNVHRLAEVSTAIIDQCVAQGVPLQENMEVCLKTGLLGCAGIKNILCTGTDRATIIAWCLSGLIKTNFIRYSGDVQSS